MISSKVRDSGESYQEFLTNLAKASGIGTPTRADLARIDRKRKNKGSNDDWTHPYDPDTRITKMKDGRTHLAPKAEQLEAVAAVTDEAVAVIEEVVADKGYHSRTTVHDLETLEIRAQSWIDLEAERDAVYANRRRI